MQILQSVQHFRFGPQDVERPFTVRFLQEIGAELENLLKTLDSENEVQQEIGSPGKKPSAGEDSLDSYDQPPSHHFYALSPAAARNN